MRVPGRLVRGRVRPDRWTALRFASMRWAALPVIDRRWTAPLSAIALGFGLFVGVAIGPGTQGSFGSNSPVMVQVPDPNAQAAAPGGPVPSGRQRPGSARLEQPWPRLRAAAVQAARLVVEPADRPVFPAVDPEHLDPTDDGAAELPDDAAADHHDPTSRHHHDHHRRNAAH